VLLSQVPRLDAGNEDAALRFVQLVDEFYDRHVNLLLSAAARSLLACTRAAARARVRAHQLAAGGDAQRRIPGPRAPP
jgi:cell division protein ZapE